MVRGATRACSKAAQIYLLAPVIHILSMFSTVDSHLKHVLRHGFTLQVKLMTSPKVSRTSWWLPSACPTYGNGLKDCVDKTPKMGCPTLSWSLVLIHLCGGFFPNWDHQPFPCSGGGPLILLFRNSTEKVNFSTNA
jgi:hypothetical protein